MIYDMQVCSVIFVLSGGINYIYDFVIKVSVPSCVIYKLRMRYVLYRHKMKSVTNYDTKRKYFI